MLTIIFSVLLSLAATVALPTNTAGAKAKQATAGEPAPKKLFGAVATARRGLFGSLKARNGKDSQGVELGTEGVWKQTAGMYTKCDATASNNWLSAINSPHCPVVYLERGRYYLDAEVVINRAVVIMAREPGTVFLDGMGTTRVLNINAPGHKVELHGINIVNGYSDGSGGGVYVRDGTVAFTRTNIYSNEARNGGGVAINDATVNFNGCHINNNQATSHGGGVLVWGLATMTFINTNIHDNTASTQGGAVHVWVSGADVKANSLEMWNNSPQDISPQDSVLPMSVTKI